MGGAIKRHRRVDPVEVAVLRWKLESRLEFLQGQLVREVSIDLVRRDQNKARVRCVMPRGLQEVQGPVGVDAEVRLYVSCGPLVRGLCSGVNDEAETLRVLGKHPLDAVGIPYVEVQRAKLGIGGYQLLRDSRGGGVGTEEAGTHVVL